MLTWSPASKQYVTHVTIFYLCLCILDKDKVCQSFQQTHFPSERYMLQQIGLLIPILSGSINHRPILNIPDDIWNQYPFGIQFSQTGSEVCFKLTAIWWISFYTALSKLKFMYRNASRANVWSSSIRTCITLPTGSNAIATDIVQAICWLFMH